MAGAEPLTREGLENLFTSFYEDHTDEMVAYKQDRENFDQELLRRLRSLKQNMKSGDATPVSMLSDKTGATTTPSISASVDQVGTWLRVGYTLTTSSCQACLSESATRRQCHLVHRVVVAGAVVHGSSTCVECDCSCVVVNDVLVL